MLSSMSTPYTKETQSTYASVLRDLISMKEVIEIENRLGVFPKGDITHLVRDWIPSLSKRIIAAADTGYGIDTHLYNEGFLYLHYKKQTEHRIYFNQHQYMVLDGDEL